MIVRYSEAFKRQLKRLSRRYPHIRGDLQPLIDRLVAGETPGDRIQGTGHVLYKVRAKNTSAARGKRGGYRVIYYLTTSTGVLLVTIYSKTEQSDVDVDVVLRIIRDEN